MIYDKLNFENGSPPAINATTLNHIETGISEAAEAITQLEADVENKANSATTLEGYGITDGLANGDGTVKLANLAQDILDYIVAHSNGEGGGVTLTQVQTLLADYAKSSELDNKEDVSNRVTSITQSFTDESGIKYPTVLALLKYLEDYYYNFEDIYAAFDGIRIDDGNLIVLLPDGEEKSLASLKGGKGDKGDKGDTPVKGIDYWTNADKAEIMGDQATPLFANDISECTDISRVYLLPDGFLYAYIKTVTEIPAYTNQLPIATGTNGDVYNGVGYASGRYSSSSTTFGSLKADEGYYTTGLIPFKMGQTLRVKGAEISELPVPAVEGIYPSFALVGSSRTTFIGGKYFNWLQHLNTVMDKTSEYYFVKSATVSNDICTFVTDKNTGSSISADDVYYISLSLKVTDPSAVIITVDEEITDEFIEEYDYNWANTGRAYAPADYEDRIVALESKLANFGTDMIYGIVDEDNAILMGGTLEAGTYTLKYQNADGTATEIGTFEVV